MLKEVWSADGPMSQEIESGPHQATLAGIVSPNIAECRSTLGDLDGCIRSPQPLYMIYTLYFCIHTLLGTCLNNLLSVFVVHAFFCLCVC